MVVVVVAVSKASSGRAWQSSSSYLSLYSVLRKKEFVLVVSFFGVFLVNFFFGERFFFLFFTLFSSKTQQQTRSILDRHTLQNNARPKLCVCVCACLWCDCRLKGTI